MAMLDPRMFDPSFYAPQLPQGTGMLNIPGVNMPAAPAMDLSARAQPPMPQQPMPQQAMQQQQQPGIFGAIGNGIASNPLTLMALGAGIMEGGFGKGLKYAMPAAQIDQQNRTATETEKALIKRGLSPDVARIAARNPSIMKGILEQSLGIGGNTDDIREYQFAKQQGFKGSFQEWVANKRAGAGEYGLNVQWGVDADGNPVMIQPGKSGRATVAELPEGVALRKDPIKMDAGTHYVLLDPITRQNIGIIPKENYQKAFDTAAGGEAGKAQGEARGRLESMKSKLPGLQTVVGRLGELSEKATYTPGGRAIDMGRRWLDMEPREAAIARTEYMAMVDNQILPLLRDTFGAQFTVQEGESLRATLGDPNKSPKEKQAVLKAFIEQKVRDIEALERQTGQVTQPTQTAPQGGAVDLKKKYGLD